MIKSKLFVIFFLLFSTCALYAQEFAYVTDSLKLRLYTEASDSSDVILAIESGDSVEVLEKQNAFSRVITNDGSEGWVKSAFLVEDPPEKLLYYAVSEQNKQLQAEIETLKNTPQIENVSSNDQEYEEQIVQLQTELSNQQQVNQSLQQQLTEVSKNIGTNIPASTTIQTSSAPNTIKNTKWFIPAIAIGILFVGFLLGHKFSTRRMRKRLHGFVLK